MDSCEVIYLSRLAQRANQRDAAPVPVVDRDAQPKPQRRPEKVVDLHAWAAAHRPVMP